MEQLLSLSKRTQKGIELDPEQRTLLEKKIKEIENDFKLQSENPLSENVKEVITTRLEKLSGIRKTHQDYLLELYQKQDHLLDAKDVILSIEEKLLRFKNLPVELYLGREIMDCNFSLY